MPNFRGARSGTYGTAHTKARAAAFAKLPTYSPCCRCGKPMWKWALDPWGKSALHYDHNDQRTGYLGFSHSTCNVRAGAAKGGTDSARTTARATATRPDLAVETMVGGHGRLRTGLHHGPATELPRCVRVWDFRPRTTNGPPPD